MGRKENRKEEGASLVGQLRAAKTLHNRANQTCRLRERLWCSARMHYSLNKATKRRVLLSVCYCWCSTSAHGAYCLQLNTKCET